MIVRIFTILALLVFLALIFMGSAIEAAMLKSATVFIVLTIGTKVSIYTLDIIKEDPQQEQESPSHN